MSETEGQPKTTRVWWQRFIELAALIAVPPTLAYALGVVALWVQLSNESGPEGEWSLWYAATIAYKPMAAGIGFGVLSRAFSFALLIGGALLLIGYVFVRLLKKRRPSDQGIDGFMVLIVPLSCIALGGMLVAFILSTTVQKVPALRIVGAPVLLYLLSFYLMWVSSPEQRSLAKRLITYYPKALYRTIPLVGIVLVVFFTLSPGALQLPCLTRHLSEGDVIGGETLTKERAAEINLQVPEGRLLANAEGYWWVFDRDGRFTAIPRDSKSHMRIKEPFGEAVSEQQC